MQERDYRTNYRNESHWNKNNHHHEIYEEKEFFDSDDLGRKRAVIKRLGVNLKLSHRTIQFAPVKYLVPVAEKYPELKEQFELARTDSEQMKKGLKEGLIS